jgi:hypothetical protein
LGLAAETDPIDCEDRPNVIEFGSAARDNAFESISAIRLNAIGSSCGGHKRRG